MDKIYYLGPTCDSKLQTIKLCFVWSTHPKRWGTPTSKIHLFNHKELEDTPPGMILRNHTYLKVYKCW